MENNKEKTSGDYYALSLGLNLVGSIIEYSSLIYGISNIIDKSSSMENLFIAGAGYIAGKFINHASKGILLDGELFYLKSNLEKIIKKEEKIK